MQHTDQSCLLVIGIHLFTVSASGQRMTCICCAETHSPGLDMEMWEAWYCQDGVTVFFGTNKENQDVLMVSLIVRAPPNLVTEVLLPLSLLPLSPILRAEPAPMHVWHVHLVYADLAIIIF